MGPIKVVVHGALGKMGREVINALSKDPETQLVGAADINAGSDRLSAPDGTSEVPLSPDLDYILTATHPDVMVDFSIAPAAIKAARTAANRGVNLVIGTTGLSPEEITEIDRLALSKGIGAFIAPNFALGAVLMMHLAKIAGKYLDYAEIIELHHHLKVDAPSGTALATARGMTEARGKPFDTPEPKPDSKSRGESVEGIGIHSVRLPGLLAHQEVIFGGPGQTLSIRHDTISRECFMPGVIIAVKKIIGQKGLVYGLDVLLGLKEER